MSTKATKKRLFLPLWRAVLKRSNVSWHATNHHEADAIRRLFPGGAIEIRQNDVALPPDPLPPEASGETARLVFLGRVSPIKNLTGVLEGLTQVIHPLIFDIYGPIEDVAYWQECHKLMRLVPANVSVTYRGELTPSEVRPTFARYDAFVFPTRGENFGHVIAESLSASCPVICSDQTPWNAVLRSGGGVVLTEPTAAALAREIDLVAAAPAMHRLHARAAAGAAYQRWRAGATQPNIFDQFRQAGRATGARDQAEAETQDA
ncbi:glycosyltransferase family 4 protein [Verrucosispora sp. WMMA2121]|uniref:glycosyltransferase family 4 protein n=1 Tax=Verrucosispora sp. WMMA2121 TaxID=3015164 RepID=UPI0022B71715|nr:glycosyltransferase family 4 protein [Verrucosispora sp. WMMA2121]MCZ7419884.1 glycosyltransferase family 4 protein [Verrucosispora sp. WMMA2121]